MSAGEPWIAFSEMPPPSWWTGGRGRRELAESHMVAVPAGSGAVYAALTLSWSNARPDEVTWLIMSSLFDEHDARGTVTAATSELHAGTPTFELQLRVDALARALLRHARSSL